MTTTGSIPFAHVHRWKQAVYNFWYCNVAGCPERRDYGGRPNPPRTPDGDSADG